MKKVNLLLIMMVGILFITGCNKTTKCTMETDQTNYKIVSEYNVTYDGDGNVVKIKTEEVVTSDDAAVLTQFEQAINSQLASYTGLKHYKYSVKNKDGKLTETIEINYKKLDVDKFLEINSGASSLFVDGKVKYDTIISVYKTLGATCEEK